MPATIPSDQPEADRQRQVRDPGCQASGDVIARQAIAVDEGAAAKGEDGGDQRADRAGDDVCDGADWAFGEKFAGRESEQLTVARGDGGAQHPEPERQRCGEGARPRDSGTEESP
jgi:hypothetical protein